MRNKIITIMFGIFLISLVSAGVVVISFNLTDVKWTPTTTTGLIKQEGTITFDCNKVSMSFNMSEPTMDIDDDFEQVIGNYCNQEVTNVQDWTGRRYKQNEYGLKSFDENKLKTDVCLKQNLTFDGINCFEDEDINDE